ncbi:hypothetical protein PT2222_380029 [Paraburkholderia tropica]
MRAARHARRLLRDQHHGRFHHARQIGLLLVLLDGLEGGIDAEHGLFGGVLVGGREHAAVLEHRLDGVDVVVAHHVDLALLARRAHGRDRADRHVVVTAEQRLQVGILVEHGRGHRIALVDFPLARLGGHDLRAERVHRVLEAGRALLRVGGGRHAFHDAHLVARLELLREVVADEARALAVVRPDERHVQVLRLEHVGIEPVVDVHDDDARVHGLLHDRHERFRVGGREHDGVDLRDDHLLDDLDLRGRIGFVLDAVGDEVEGAGVVLLVVLRAVFHGQEELVGERLHDERDLGLVGRRLRMSGERRERDGGEGDGRAQHATADAEVHRLCLRFVWPGAGRISGYAQTFASIPKRWTGCRSFSSLRVTPSVLPCGHPSWRRFDPEFDSEPPAAAEQKVQHDVDAGHHGQTGFVAVFVM